MSRLIQLGLGVLFGFSLSLKAAEPGASRIGVLTYNVFFQNTNWMSVVELLKRADADVVALQETTLELETLLRRELGDQYAHMDFRHAPGSGGLALLSRLEVRFPRYVTVTNRAARGILLAEVKGRDGRWIQCANIHLPTPRVGQMKTVTTALQVFERAGAAQEREIKRVWESLRATDTRSDAILILGDFNSFSFGPAQAFLKEKGMKDSFAEVTPDADQHPTWYWRERGGAHRYRIDYIFHSSVLRTVSSRVWVEGSSDHYPVESVVE